MKCFDCGGPHPAYDCRRAREIGFTARSPFAGRVPGRPPGADYLAAKAKLKRVTSGGEVDPRRLHGPDLARWQLREARESRGPDVDAWLSSVASQRPGTLSGAAARESALPTTSPRRGTSPP